MHACRYDAIPYARICVLDNSSIKAVGNKARLPIVWVNAPSATPANICRKYTISFPLLWSVLKYSKPSIFRKVAMEFVSCQKVIFSRSSRSYRHQGFAHWRAVSAQMLSQFFIKSLCVTSDEGTNAVARQGSMSNFPFYLFFFFFPREYVSRGG